MPLNNEQTVRGGMVITTTTAKKPEYEIEYKNNSFNAGKKYTNSKNLSDSTKGEKKMTVPEAISILLGNNYQHDKIIKK